MHALFLFSDVLLWSNNWAYLSNNHGVFDKAFKIILFDHYFEIED